MIAVDPKLQEWLDKNQSVLSEQLDALKKESEEGAWVEGINGDRRRVKDVVRDTHYDVQAIKKDIQILRDFSGFHKFMKKYRGYWLLGMLLFYIMGTLGLDITLNTIKNHLP